MARVPTDRAECFAGVLAQGTPVFILPARSDNSRRQETGQVCTGSLLCIRSRYVRSIRRNASGRSRAVWS